MRRRYQETRQKFKEYSRQFNKKNRNDTQHTQQKPAQNINIHIFNITSRNRNIITSTDRKYEKLDESMNLEDRLRRGGSVFHRKTEKQALNTSVGNGPVVPTYGLKCKPSGSQLSIYTKEQMVSSEATPSANIKDTAEEEVNIEELHFEKVKLQLKWKRLIQQQ